METTIHEVRVNIDYQVQEIVVRRKTKAVSDEPLVFHIAQSASGDRRKYYVNRNVTFPKDQDEFTIRYERFTLPYRAKLIAISEDDSLSFEIKGVNLKDRIYRGEGIYKPCDV